MFVRDSGLLHSLLDIASLEQLEGHARVGGSWEGFGIAGGYPLDRSDGGRYGLVTKISKLASTAADGNTARRKS